MSSKRSVQDLFDEGSLTPAAQPRHNLSRLPEGRYTLPLIAHDYPAKTAAMWNAAYATFGIDAGNLMAVGRPEDVPTIFDVLRRDPLYLGGGAGVGFKTEALRYVDELDAVAAATQAINLVVHLDNGRLRGYNTDGVGYVESLLAALGSVGGRHVMLLGAGGTARSIAFALAAEGAKVTVVNRTVAAAQQLADAVNTLSGRTVVTAADEGQLPRLAPLADAVVNTTTKGSAGELAEYAALAPASLPVTPSSVTANLAESERVMASLPAHTIVSDVVIQESATPMLRLARQRGLRTLDGLPMVINQGVASFAIIHGDEMRERGISVRQIAAVMQAAAMA